MSNVTINHQTCMSSMLHWWTFVPCYTLVTILRYLYIVTLELWHPTEVCFLDNPARHLLSRERPAPSRRRPTHWSVKKHYFNNILKSALIANFSILALFISKKLNVSMIQCRIKPWKMYKIKKYIYIFPDKNKH